MYADVELLRRYAESRSETAFAELVQRHLSLVYSVAVRQCGGDTHLAKDVTQCVFSDLARKAAALTDRPVLSGWLYRAAQYAATDVVRAERRRRAREQEAQAMQELSTNPATEADWDRLRPVLDQAIGELNDRDRDAVMLRFVEGRAFANIGATLRLSEDAARMRVDRALDKLRALLARRGIDSTSAALAVALSNQAAATAPAGLAASISGTALSGAAVAEAGAVAAVIAFMTATKTTVTLGVAAALALATAVYQSSQARTTGAALANATREHAAARARMAEMESKARAAEQALADREQIRTELAATNAAAAASKASAAAAAAKAEAEQQKALQQYLDNHPQLRMLKANASRAYKQASKWPVFFGLGMTPEQAERANIITEETYARRKAQLDAGLKLPPPDQAPLRAAFGDAAAERMIEFNKVRWEAGEIVKNLSSSLYHADEPFTAQQRAQLLEILAKANRRTTERIDWDNPMEVVFDWDQILTQAEPVLSPAQMRGLRAQAGYVRMQQVWAAATKEAAAAAKK